MSGFALSLLGICFLHIKELVANSSPVLRQPDELTPHNINTDVLLIDEALAAGGAHFRAKSVNATIKRISSEQPVVLVSHSTEQIVGLCNTGGAYKNTAGYCDPAGAVEHGPG